MTTRTRFSCLSFLQEIRIFSARRTILLSVLLAAIPLYPKTTPKHTLFTSPEDSVAFAYPAAWLLNADDDAATAKLRLADLGPPRAVVQLEGNFTGAGPYKDTDFDAGAFAYTAVPARNAAACFALADRLGNRAATSTTLDHRPARESRFTAAVAGTEDIHHVVVTLGHEQCFVFETVLIRRSPDTVAHPLSPARWHQLQNAFESVFRSIRLN